MHIQIPFAPKSPGNVVLRRCIREAAESTGVDDYRVALIMSRFFESVADAMARGEVVTVPNFGAFGPRKSKPRRKDAKPVTAPAFSGARGLREQVAFCSLEKSQEAREFMRRHCQNHHRTSASTDSNSKTWRGMEVFRDHVRAQARKVGIVLPPEPDPPGAFKTTRAHLPGLG